MGLRLEKEISLFCATSATTSAADFLSPFKNASFHLFPARDRDLVLFSFSPIFLCDLRENVIFEPAVAAAPKRRSRRPGSEHNNIPPPSSPSLPPNISANFFHFFSSLHFFFPFSFAAHSSLVSSDLKQKRWLPLPLLSLSPPFSRSLMILGGMGKRRHV